VRDLLVAAVHAHGDIKHRSGAFGVVVVDGSCEGRVPPQRWTKSGKAV
jgi:hypothetical protein